MSRRPLSRLIAVGAAALFLACQPAGQQERAEWRVVSSEELTADQILKHDRAIAARDAMFQSLKGRLMEVVGTSGPAAAIDVCAEEAPLIAKRISEAHGLSIGRTSFRLRNPNNVPPAWAASLVSDRVEEPTILARDGSLGVLFPIRLQAECVVCHGPPTGFRRPSPTRWRNTTRMTPPRGFSSATSAAGSGSMSPPSRRLAREVDGASISE